VERVARKGKRRVHGTGAPSTNASARRGDDGGGGGGGGERIAGVRGGGSAA